MNYLYLIIPALFLFIIIIVIIFHFRKKVVIKKVNSLNEAEKDTILDTITQNIGYTYDSSQDIFMSRLDAPQRFFGYTNFFDLSAPYFNMIFDYETIYFNYNSRTWLIEMWKGQYGINTGCELGVYYADSIVSPDKYKSTVFSAVEDNDMPVISLVLNRHYPKDHYPSTEIARERNRHWWLTIFKLGTFSKPYVLSVNTTIRFRDANMMSAFLKSFKETLPNVEYRVRGLTVYFTFFESERKYSFFKKIVRRTALAFCHMYCNFFNRLTKAFSGSGDKILYLYYYLPFSIRLLFKNKKRK